MEKFIRLDGLVAPLDRANVDTDAIIPKQFLKSIKRSGFGPNLFDEWRYMDVGQPGQDCQSRPKNPNFVLNQPRYAGANILQARALCTEAAARFPLKMGRVHEKPVGPHPDWSCQLAFRAGLFEEIVIWLAMHRAGLVVFIHPVTGNDLIDHRDYAIWMGAVRPLDLSVLSDRDTPVSYDF